jgi:hypothetical protein
MLTQPPQDTVNVPADTAPFRKIIDSTTMLAVVRFAWPAILMLLGYLGSMQLSDLKEGQKTGLAELKTGQTQVWVQMGKLSDAQTVNSVAIGTLTSKMDGGLKQLDHLQAQVDRLPSR